MVKGQIGIRQVGATVLGVIGFLGSCVCVCMSTSGARGSEEEQVSFCGPTEDSALFGH